MEANKSKPESKYKQHMPIFPFLCLLFGLLALFLSIAHSVAFYLYLNSGGLNVSAGSWWCLLSFLWPACFLITLFLIVVSVVLAIFKKPRLLRILVTLVSLVLNISGYMMAYRSGFVGTETVDLRYSTYNEIYLRALTWIKQTIPEYSKKHDGQLPPMENWCDILVEFDPNISDALTGYSVSKLQQSSRYALNSNLAGMRLADVPAEVVLFFETKPGRNPIGGHESITAQHHYGKGCIILFGDLHIEFVKAEDFNDLRWKP